MAAWLNWPYYSPSVTVAVLVVSMNLHSNRTQYVLTEVQCLRQTCLNCFEIFHCFGSLLCCFHCGFDLLVIRLRKILRVPSPTCRRARWWDWRPAAKWAKCRRARSDVGDKGLFILHLSPHGESSLLLKCDGLFRWILLMVPTFLLHWLVLAVGGRRSGQVKLD